MTELDDALATRDGILNQMLALKEYAPMTRQRQSLNIFMLTGHQETGMPMKLRQAQAKVLELLASYIGGSV